MKQTIQLDSEGLRLSGDLFTPDWLHDAESVKPIYGGAEAIAAKISQAKAAKKTFAQTGK